MRSLFFTLLAFGISQSAFAAEYSVTGATGWKVIAAEDIKEILGFICPGSPAADFVITKESPTLTEKEDEQAKRQTALCVRKLKSDGGNLSDRNQDWRRALWSEQTLRRMVFLYERAAKTNEIWKYTVQATFDVKKKVPQKIAANAQVVNGQIYLFAFEQGDEVYKAASKDVIELLKNVSVEVTTDEHGED